ncbi:MAG: hypothetical protein QOG53_2190 [Frankiales bacterium]|jgi:hypothetical protein|nr:hypothetical protein [Frankiales bacterium]
MASSTSPGVIERMRGRNFSAVEYFYGCVARCVRRLSMCEHAGGPCDGQIHGPSFSLDADVGASRLPARALSAGCWGFLGRGPGSDWVWRRTGARRSGVGGRRRGGTAMGGPVRWLREYGQLCSARSVRGCRDRAKRCAPLSPALRNRATVPSSHCRCRQPDDCGSADSGNMRNLWRLRHVTPVAVIAARSLRPMPSRPAPVVADHADADARLPRACRSVTSPADLGWLPGCGQIGLEIHSTSLLALLWLQSWCGWLDAAAARLSCRRCWDWV